MAGSSWIGKSVPSIDSFEKVTGAAIYTIDLNFPGMLVGKVLRSPLPHARILHIDTRKAERIRGVKAIITADDTPKVKFGMGPSYSDKLPLEDKKVRCIGDEIAAVAAIDEDRANEALAAIQVDFEELPAVYDPVVAMREGAPRIHDHLETNVAAAPNLNCGDVEVGFREADLIVEEEFRTPAQTHCCLEVHNVVARWEPGGRVTVWASNQSPHALKSRLAKACNLSSDQFHIIKPHLGGAFGSKANMLPMEPIAVFLAQKSGGTVKIENSREEEFITCPPRHPTLAKLKFGFKMDGRLTAKQARVIMDNGAYNSTGPAILAYNCIMFSALYRAPNVKYDGYLVYTNKLANGSFRGFGTYQAMFGHEVMMDLAAEKLGMDPKDIRLINANLPDETTINRVHVTTCGLTETIEKATDKSRWAEKRRSRTRGRGIGMACLIHTGSGSNIFGANYSAAHIDLDIDGSVTLYTGAADIGQGSNTILLQMAAEILGLGIEDIRLVQGDTDATPADIGTKGSRLTYCAGLAVSDAAENLRRQILDAVSQMLEVNGEDLVIHQKAVRVKSSPQKGVSFSEIAQFSFFRKRKPLVGNGLYNQPIQKEADPVTGYGYDSPVMIFGTQVAEVEVDEETGFVTVIRITSAHDIGRIINPLLAEGQAEGGIVQGLGGALMESITFDGGKVANAGFTDYKIFTAMDSAPVDCLWIETRDPSGPFGAKGFSEAATIATAPAVANAIYNAVGVRVNELPMSPEKILQALKKKRP